MKYTAYLTTGGTIEIDFDPEAPVMVAGFLIGDNGSLVNPKFVAALEPIETPAVPQPDSVIDMDGDRWTLKAGLADRYVLADGGRRYDNPWTLSEIRETFGLRNGDGS